MLTDICRIIRLADVKSVVKEPCSLSWKAAIFTAVPRPERMRSMAALSVCLNHGSEAGNATFSCSIRPDMF